MPIRRGKLLRLWETATVFELKSHQPCLSYLNFHILGERQLDTLLNSYAWMQSLLSVHFPKIFLGELSNAVIAYQNLSLCVFRKVLRRLNCVKEGQAREWEKQDPSVKLDYVFSNYSTLSWGWLQVTLTSLTIQHRWILVCILRAGWHCRNLSGLLWSFRSSSIT